MKFLVFTSMSLMICISSNADLGVTGSNTKEKTMCIPIFGEKNNNSMYHMCDAIKVNKQYKLKIGQHNCALSDQPMPNEGYIVEQLSYKIYGETDAELEKNSLPACSIDQITGYTMNL